MVSWKTAQGSARTDCCAPRENVDEGARREEERGPGYVGFHT